MRPRRLPHDDVSTRLAERSIDAVKALVGDLASAQGGAFVEAARAHPKLAWDALVSATLDALTSVLAGARGLAVEVPGVIEVCVDSVRLRASDRASRALREALVTVDGEAVAPETLPAEHLGAVYERLLEYELSLSRGAIVLTPGLSRRRAGAHYTPRALAAAVVRDTLAPLLAALGERPAPEAVLSLRVCDPAMGAGAFLVEVCRQLGDALVACDARRFDDVSARREVARRCLYGVDVNPRAARLARRALWLAAGGASEEALRLDHALREGHALVGVSHGEARGLYVAPARAHAPIEGLDDPDALRFAADCALACALTSPTVRTLEDRLAACRAKIAAREQSALARAELDALVGAALRDDGAPFRALHWELDFDEVARRGGFDAVVGNPPWVSYAGRAAQPIDPALKRFYTARYEAFRGYRNLQALFVERAARAVRASGRVGLVLPSSMAELDGYGPSRAAHDRWARCDDELPDLGEDGFLGVFQPSMVLRSTAREAPLLAGSDAWWPLERPDVDPEAQALLAKLSGPPLPAALFGERGLQTSGDDVDHCVTAPDAKHTVALRVGSDIAAFRKGAPSLWADATWFGARLRAPEAWREVAVLIRQTARVPIAVRSDGAGFRNSILAGFERDGYTADLLVAYLNSSPVRWKHYYSHRDARLGMPQVKIGHLRSIPAPPSGLVGPLAAMGAALSSRNEAPSAEALRALDALVCDAFGLSEPERARIERDAARW